jgi:hypothetical protein
MPASATSGTLGQAGPLSIPSIGENPNSNKLLVFIHGAGHFAPANFDPVVKHVQDDLGRPVASLAIIYSDLFDLSTGRAGVQASADSVRVERLQADLQNELVRDAFLRAFADVPTDRMMAALTIAAATGGPVATNLAGLAAMATSGQVNKITPELWNRLAQAFPGIPIPDWLGKATPSSVSVDAAGGTDPLGVIRQVCQYLGNHRTQGAVQTRIREKLDSVISAYDEIVLVTHSLGTVVAFDVLHDCADRYDKISHWFTLGSPLAKVMRLGRRSDLGRINYRTVKHWFNLYDTTDVIANALGPLFSKPDYLIYDIFVDVAEEPMPSHDYFRNSQTLDYIAAAMR